MYNLTENQKNILKWIVKQVREGKLQEDFYFMYTANDGIHYVGRGVQKIENSPFLSVGTMKALMASNLVIFEEEKEERFTTNHCTLLGNAYLAVDSNFGENPENIGFAYFTSVFGEPNPRYTYNVFVLMPFTLDLKPVFDNHIKNIAKELNLSIARADDFFSQNSIMEEIWSAIAQSSVLIADCTNKNPNVFYEIGIAHAIGKPVILITQNPEDVPFDLRHRRYIHYSYTPPGMQKFETDLYKTLVETMKDLNKSNIKPN